MGRSRQLSLICRYGMCFADTVLRLSCRDQCPLFGRHIRNSRTSGKTTLYCSCHGQHPIPSECEKKPAASHNTRRLWVITASYAVWLGWQFAGKLPQGVKKQGSTRASPRLKAIQRFREQAVLKPNSLERTQPIPHSSNRTIRTSREVRPFASLVAYCHLNWLEARSWEFPKPKKTAGYNGVASDDITEAIYPGLTVANHY